MPAISKTKRENVFWKASQLNDKGELVYYCTYCDRIMNRQSCYKPDSGCCDHVKPEAFGGSNDEGNLAAACCECVHVKNSFGRAILNVCDDMDSLRRLINDRRRARGLGHNLKYVTPITEIHPHSQLVASVPQHIPPKPVEEYIIVKSDKPAESRKAGVSGGGVDAPDDDNPNYCQSTEDNQKAIAANEELHDEMVKNHNAELEKVKGDFEAEKKQWHRLRRLVDPIEKELERLRNMKLTFDNTQIPEQYR